MKVSQGTVKRTLESEEITDTEKEYPAVYNLGQHKHKHKHPSGTTFEELEEWHCRHFWTNDLLPSTWV